MGVGLRPVAKAPEVPSTPYRPRVSPRLYHEWCRYPGAGAQTAAPKPGDEIRIWSDLHLGEDRIRVVTERPWRSVREMDAALRWRWCSAMTADTTLMICAGDLGPPRGMLLRRRPAAEGLPGPWHAVLGNHDFTRLLGRERPLGAGSTSMTLVIETTPMLLVTHVPLWDVPAGCVNVHGHLHRFKPLKQGRWINVSVEHTAYRPLNVRTEVLPLARALAGGHIPYGNTTMEWVSQTATA